MNVEKKIANLGKKFATLGVNSFCPWVLYITKPPEKAKKLKKKL